MKGNTATGSTKRRARNYWEEKIRQGIYCSGCGKRLSWKEVEDGVMFVGKPVCKKDLNRRMDW
jgi:hypothetical protein